MSKKVNFRIVKKSIGFEVNGDLKNFDYGSSGSELEIVFKDHTINGIKLVFESIHQMVFETMTQLGVSNLDGYELDLDNKRLRKTAKQETTATA